MEEFKHIQQLINLIKERKPVSDIPLSFSSPPRTKIELFFQKVGNGDFIDDNQASLELYKSKASNPSYKMLKRRLTDKLTIQLFLLDLKTKNISKEGKAYFGLLTQFLAIKILLNTSNTPLALPLFKKNIKIAEKYKFSDIGFLLSSTFIGIINEYSILDHKNPELIKLYKKANFFREATLLELKIDEAFGEIIGSLAKGVNSNKSKILENYNKLLGIAKDLNQVSTLRAIKYYYALSAVDIYFKNYRKAIENCVKGIRNLKKAKITAISWIYLLKAQCHLHLEDVDLARQTMAEGEKLKTNPNSNRFTSFDITFLIEARACNFPVLPTIYDKVISDPKFRLKPEIAIESWHQYGLLLLFLIQLNKIPPSESLDRIKPKLRLGKLMNELQEYSKDKAGLNLSIRILHTLILLVSKRYEEFEESLPLLQSYIHRYIRKYPELMRSNLLVKMLSQIPKVDYNAERAAWRARPMLEKMIVPPEQLPLKITEMEVIPYEKMWQFVVEFLGTLKKRPHTKPRQP